MLLEIAALVVIFTFAPVVFWLLLVGGGGLWLGGLLAEMFIIGLVKGEEDKDYYDY